MADHIKGTRTTQQEQLHAGGDKVCSHALLYFQKLSPLFNSNLHIVYRLKSIIFTAKLVERCAQTAK